MMTGMEVVSTQDNVIKIRAILRQTTESFPDFWAAGSLEWAIHFFFLILMGEVTFYLSFQWMCLLQAGKASAAPSWWPPALRCWFLLSSECRGTRGRRPWDFSCQLQHSHLSCTIWNQELELWLKVASISILVSQISSSRKKRLPNV